MIEVPSGSIYIWMYVMGLKHVPYKDVERAVYDVGKDVRPKDYDNYWRGFYNSDLYYGEGESDLTLLNPRPEPPTSLFLVTPWDEYPAHPYIRLPEIEQRWIPCNQLNKPMIRWKQRAMFKDEAERYFGMQYLAENLKGTKMIVIDCDGDHSDTLDMETINFLWRYHDMTHAMDKPKTISEYDGYETSLDFRPASFHLTFAVDKVIPTMHFPDVGIDIIGNRKNSLRYYKNKVHNGLEPKVMTPTIWRELQEYIRYRKENKCSRRGRR